VSIQAGTHTFGPDNGTLSVRTGRTGAAAKAGHNLLIQVTAWQATFEVGEDPAQTSIVLVVDPTSFRVREGTGGMQALGDDDKANIEATIDDEVLKRMRIEFRSTAVQTAPGGDRISVQGELTLVGETRPVSFDLAVGADGTLSGSIVLKQTNWGMTPYSTLFGTLKVTDDVEVVIDTAGSRADSAHLTATPEWPDRSDVQPRPKRLPVPSVGTGVTNVLWTLVFLLYIWFGMAAVDVSHRTALPLAVMASFCIFLFIRSQGAGRQDS
jgi:polyisoprenoid-binding protein YceI